ncbi:hypothetical protein NDU88_006173, partial [Pleurodeles waltl]
EARIEEREEKTLLLNANVGKNAEERSDCAWVPGFLLRQHYVAFGAYRQAVSR